jgi:hypothetical protein
MSAAVGSVSQLVATIRAQLAGRAPPAAAGKRSRGQGAAAARERYASEGLGELIALRVRMIGRDDPGRGRKAFRVFLEAVMLAEFGAGLANDARFHQLIDDVQRAMEADPACLPLVDSAIEQLLAEG